MSAKLSKEDKIRQQMGDLTGPAPTAMKMINGLPKDPSLVLDNTPKESVLPEPVIQTNVVPRADKLELADLLPRTEKTKTLPIKLLPVLHKAAVACAEKRNMTLHDYVVRALAEKVQRDSNKE